MQTTRVHEWRVRSPQDLGRAIAGVRTARSLTQADLAAGTGIHRSYIAELERGASTLLLDRALRMLRRMGATVTVTVSVEEGSADAEG